MTPAAAPPPADADPLPPGTWGDWLADRTIRALIALALAMPWGLRLRFMGAMLAWVIGPLAGYRRRALDNLAMIRPDLPASERNRIARGVLNNFGRTLIENYAWQSFGPRLDHARLTGDGLTALRQARDAGRPVIFLTGHFGNHEAPRQVLTRMGYRIGGLYRAMDNRYFNAHYAATMTGLSGPVFAKGRRGTMAFARHLKAGGMATILFDLHDKAGVPLPFLGRPALTATSAADLALRFNAVLIPYFGIRQPDGLSFDIAIETPIPASDPVTMMAEATRRLEARIARNPEQWFWVHRRWKGAPAAISPAAPPP